MTVKSGKVILSSLRDDFFLLEMTKTLFPLEECLSPNLDWDLEAWSFILMDEIGLDLEVDLAREGKGQGCEELN